MYSKGVIKILFCFSKEFVSKMVETIVKNKKKLLKNWIGSCFLYKKCLLGPIESNCYKTIGQYTKVRYLSVPSIGKCVE